MEPLHCIVIDDEPIGQDVVVSFIEKIPYLQLGATFGDPMEAFMYLQQHEVDIIFSDIQMPKMNGLELVRSLEKPPVIIFITAHRDFALEGYETGVMDYLVKPVRFDRFVKAVNRTKEYIDMRKQPAIQQVSADRVFIKADGKLIKILLGEILYVEAQGDYLKIVIANETFTTLGTLKSMDEVLTLPKFFRVQRSFILNLEMVRSVTGNMVELVNGKTITIALNKKDELFQLLGIK
ncbi:LytTR family two component transcriptional regulator [Chitinophaga skermanii]|uniref:LytTR family two component transcriptional regulator n=1 Tax=Chitinophaga skermanii TaxID=331697 RepID=A0A327Q3E1_9BACT|nr:LytTR family DNA-binding domain-containing protein [Chitinophaga skermanii]RAI97702.1 LytTR family two component transcriptional regulator [Chitinophaga skermanii]